MKLHPNTAVLAPLIGTWRGRGHGIYPTIAPFDFSDEWVFSHSGKPFVGFVERTTSMAGTPMHTESGYLRMKPDGSVEIIAALPTGQTEMGSGTVCASDGAIEVTTDAAVANTPSAKQVDRVTRAFHVEGDVLTIELAMAAVGQDLDRHIVTTLQRAV